MSAYESMIMAAKQAVSRASRTTGGDGMELANFIRQASTLARCLQLLLSSIVNVSHQA